MIKRLALRRWRIEDASAHESRRSFTSLEIIADLSLLNRREERGVRTVFRVQGVLITLA